MNVFLMLIAFLPGQEYYEEKTASPFPPASLGDAQVLLIGIDRYQIKGTSFGQCSPRLKNLNAAERDVQDLEKLIKGVGSRTSVRTLTNEGAGLTAIRCAFEEIENRSHDQARSLLFVVWSGHGIYCEQDRQYALATHDGFLPMHELQLMFESAKIKVPNRVLVLDTCHSGGVHRTSDLRQYMEQKTNQRAGSRSVYLVSGNARQNAKEDPRGGYFVQALIRGFRGLAMESIGPDTRIAVKLSDVFDYASEELSKRTNGEQIAERSGPNLDGFIYTLENRCDPDKALVSSNMEGEYRSHRTMDLKLTFSESIHPWINVDNVRLAFKKCFRKKVYYFTMNKDEQKPRLYRLSIKGTDLPLGRLCYWFEFNYGDNRTYATCANTLRVRGRGR